MDIEKWAKLPHKPIIFLLHGKSSEHKVLSVESLSVIIWTDPGRVTNTYFWKKQSMGKTEGLKKPEIKTKAKLERNTFYE